MKLCKDCAHARHQLSANWGAGWATWEGAQCAHPDVLSLVDGQVVAFCEPMRKYQDCGKDARLFEQRDGPDPVLEHNNKKREKYLADLEIQKAAVAAESVAWSASVRKRGFFAWLFRL